MICNEATPKENDERQKEFIDLLDCNIYSKKEFVIYLNNAGFSNIKTFINESKDSFTGEDTAWICVIAKKF